MSDLRDKKCLPCEGGVAPLDASIAAEYLQKLHPDWQLKDTPQAINRVFRFKNYHETMAFVNALAWIAHKDDHHPQLLVSYNRCNVEYSTHAINGLSENDFICAAKIDALLL